MTKLRNHWHSYTRLFPSFLCFLQFIFRLYWWNKLAKKTVQFRRLYIRVGEKKALFYTLSACKLKQRMTESQVTCAGLPKFGTVIRILILHFHTFRADKIVCDDSMHFISLFHGAFWTTQGSWTFYLMSPSKRTCSPLLRTSFLNLFKCHREWPICCLQVAYLRYWICLMEDVVDILWDIQTNNSQPSSIDSATESIYMKLLHSASQG